MAKIKREFIFFTSISSGLAVILSLTALGTSQWIVANGYSVQNTDQSFSIKYGLFSGTLEEPQPSGLVFEIRMICSFGDNSCAMLCQNLESGRKQELTQLITNQCIDFDYSCPQVQRSFKGEMDDFVCDPNRQRTFINSGCYLTTMIFLVLSGACGLIATILSVWNTGGNPIHAIFNVLGLYIFNALAAASVLLAICIWGTEYASNLIYNPAILYTIIGSVDSQGLVFLGFSYWILLVSLFLYIVSIFLLWFRQYRIEMEPQVKIDIDDTNENIMLY